MNAVTALLLATYLGAVAWHGNVPELWQLLKTDAPDFVPWLVALMLLLLAYRLRGALGPAGTVVGAVVIGGLVAVLVASAPAFKTAMADIGRALTPEQ